MEIESDKEKMVSSYIMVKATSLEREREGGGGCLVGDREKATKKN